MSGNELAAFDSQVGWLDLGNIRSIASDDDRSVISNEHLQPCQFTLNFIPNACRLILKSAQSHGRRTQKDTLDCLNVHTMALGRLLIVIVQGQSIEQQRCPCRGDKTDRSAAVHDIGQIGDTVRRCRCQVLDQQHNALCGGKDPSGRTIVGVGYVCEWLVQTNDGSLGNHMSSLGSVEFDKVDLTIKSISSFFLVIFAGLRIPGGKLILRVRGEKYVHPL